MMDERKRSLRKEVESFSKRNSQAGTSDRTSAVHDSPGRSM